MVDLKITFSSQTAFGTGINYDTDEIENGILLHSVTNRTVTHGHTFTATNQTGHTVIKITGVLNAITSGFHQIGLLFKLHAVTIKTKTLDISSIGPYSLELHLNRSGQSAPPTYLEKLDSMDQYTKAQYIPRNRR